MNCQQVHKLKEAHVDGRLPEAQSQRIEAHLATCPRCAARVALARRVQQELAPTLQQAIGDPRLSPAAEARIRAQLWAAVEPSRPQFTWRRWITWGVAPALALGAVILLALAILPLLTPQLPATQQAFITPPARETPAPSPPAVALRPTWTPLPPTSTPAPTASPAGPVATRSVLRTQPATVAPTSQPTQPATVAPTSQPTQPLASPQPTPTGVPVTPSAVIAGARTPTAGGTWKRYLEGESVTCVIRRGTEAWAGMANGQVVRLNTVDGERARYTLNKDAPAPVTSLAVDAGDQVWAATSGQGAFVLTAMDATSGPTWQAYTAANAGLSTDAVHALAVDAAGTVWCGTAGFVNRFTPKDTRDGRAWQSFAVPGAGPDTQVTALAAAAPDTLWVGVRGRYLTETATYSGGGLYRLQVEDSPAWEKVLSDDVGIVQAIFVRSDGHLWVATSPTGDVTNPRARGGGVVVWNGKDWTLYEALGAGMPSRHVVGVVVDAQGRAWIATDRGLVVYEGTQYTVYQAANSGLVSDNVQAIVLDKDGSTWLATDAGLCRLSEQ